MLIFLYGEDTYRSKQKLNQLVERYAGVHKQGFSLQQIDCASIDFFDIKGELQTRSLFKEKKLVILKNVFGNSQLVKSFLDHRKLLEALQDVIVFFEEGVPEASDRFFQFLKKYAKHQEFAPLETSLLKRWIASEFQRYHTTAESKVVEILASQVGNDLWQLSQEIQKLSAFAKSHASLVRAVDAEHLLRRNLETDIFVTLEEVAKKNKGGALEQITKHLAKDDNSLYLLSMLSFQFRNLLLINDMVEKRIPYQLMAKKSKLHPFVVKKGLALAQRFAFADLKTIYQKIFELDLKIKKGLIEPAMGLYLFITQL